LERKEIISLLAQRIAQLPELQKKVLAMYYYENMQLSKIAAISGTTESQIRQIRAQAVAVLCEYFTKGFDLAAPATAMASTLAQCRYYLMRY